MNFRTKFGLSTQPWTALSLAALMSGCASLASRPGAVEAQAEKPTAPSSVPEKGPTKEAGFRASSDYHFTMAQAYVAEGNPDRAIEEYKLALNYDPHSALIFARLAAEYLKKSEMTLALEACKEALQRDPKFTDARLMLAGIYSSIHQTEAALKEYDAILKYEPKNEEAMVYKAGILFDESRQTEALKALRAFTKKAPESPLALYYLARAYQRQGQTKEAATTFRAALQVRPGFTQATLGLGYLYEEASQTKEAIQVYQELYESTQDPIAANRLATLYLKAERYAEAVPYLEMLETTDPDDLNARVKLGLVHMQLKNHDKAIQIFQALIAKTPESDRIRYYLGSLYEEQKKPELAIEQLEKIPPTSKLFSDASLHVAFLLKQDGKMSEAKASIARAITQAPNLVGLYLFQASLEDETKNLPGAIAILEKTKRKFPEDEKTHYYLGTLYDRQGDQDSALEQMEKILTLNPDNADALNYLGYTWTQKGVRLDDAEKVLRKALSLKPNNGFIQDSWGWYLFVRGRIAESVVALEKAVKLTPKEAAILEHLADAYSRQNLQEKAALRYREALELADSDDTRATIQRKLDVLREELARSGRELNAPMRAPAGVR